MGQAVMFGRRPEYLEAALTRIRDAPPEQSPLTVMWSISASSSTRNDDGPGHNERRRPEGRVVAPRCDVGVPRCVD
jgi:hypothetical protein